VAALLDAKVIDKAPTSKTDYLHIQDAFNEWSEQSHRSLSEMSRIMGMSIDA
jgi:hypothetical protein